LSDFKGLMPSPFLLLKTLAKSDAERVPTALAKAADFGSAFQDRREAAAGRQPFVFCRANSATCEISNRTPPLAKGHSRK
jgi:hypothetical protein